MPQVLKAREAPPVPLAKVKKVKKSMGAVTKKAPAFEVHNTESPTTKHETVQRLWGIMSKMDPDGDLFVDDKGLISVAGDLPKTRTPKALKLSPQDTALVESMAVADSPEEDNVELATGVVFTMYQMVEMAFDMGMAAGRAEESAKFTKSLVEAAVEDDDEDDDYSEPEVLDEEDDVALDSTEGTDLEEDEDEDDDEDFDDDDDMEVIEEEEEYEPDDEDE